MKSEEIIENLLRKKYISPKEALILLKDIAGTNMSKTERYHYYKDFPSTYINTTNEINWEDIFSSTGSPVANDISNNISSIKTHINCYDTNP